MVKDKCCECGGDVKLIFPCSGGSDVGAVADIASRKLSKKGVGKMSCLAGIGGGISGFIKSAQAACKLLVIDGCELKCASKSLEKAGVSTFEHILVTDSGFTKNKIESIDEASNTVAERAGKLLK